MENLNYFLSLVTDEPVALAAGVLSKAFPGCEEHEISDLALSDGFGLGDFMNEQAVSVSHEVFSVDVSFASRAPIKESHVVWRVALKSGPVALLRLRVTGKEDSVSNDVVINGEGLVINDSDLEPFVRARMVERARRAAFNEVEAIVQSAAAMTKNALGLFNSNPELAAQATARLNLVPESTAT